MNVFTRFHYLSFIAMLFTLSGCSNKLPSIYSYNDYSPKNEIVSKSTYSACIEIDYKFSSIDFLVPESENRFYDSLEDGFMSSFDRYVSIAAPLMKISTNKDCSNKDSNYQIKMNFRHLKGTISIASKDSTKPRIENVGMTASNGLWSAEERTQAMRTDVYNFGVLVGRKLLDTLATDENFIAQANKSKLQEEIAENKRKEDATWKEKPEVIKDYILKTYAQISTKDPSHLVRNSFLTYKKAIEDGYKVVSIPYVNSTLAILDEGNVRIDNIVPEQDVPLKPSSVAKSQIPRLLSGSEALILLQPISVITKRNIVEQSKVDSKYVYDHSITPNPEYAVAEREYQAALNEYQIAQNNQGSQKAASSRSGIIAQALIGGSINIAYANRVDQARLKLSQTPSTIDTPLEKAYTYNKMKVNVGKEIVYRLYVIDPVKKYTWNKIFTKKDSKIFTLQYDRHVEDTNGDYVSIDKESDVTEYEKEKIPLSVSDVINNLVDSEIKSF